MEATNQTTQSNSLDGARAWFAERGLARRREDRMLAGVAGAFARRYEVNPFAMRVFAVLGVLLRPRSRTSHSGFSCPRPTNGPRLGGVGG